MTNKPHKPAIDTEKLKFIGGAIIVAAAALIMFPGFISLAAGFGRLLFIMVVIGGGCLLLAVATRRIMKLNAPKSGPLDSTNSNPTNSAPVQISVNDLTNRPDQPSPDTL